MSGKRITSRCRPTTVRNVFDNITARFTDEATNILKKLHLHQFIRLHGIKQDSVAITSILSCWDIKKQAFQLGGQYIPFTPDEVALMIGMPNRGEKVVWQKSPLSLFSSSDYKSQLENSDGSLPAAQFVQLYIRFLLSNLFFVYHNYRVASELIAYADDIDRFAEYNWADAIWDFLVSQFDVIASKIQTQRAAGYMSGFVTLLMIWAAEHISIIIPSSEPAKPRMLRWAKIEFPKNAFTGLGGRQVRLSFEDLLEDENWLLHSESSAQQSRHVEPDSSPVLSPITEAPTDSPYISPRYSPPSSVSSLPSASTPTADFAVERMFAGLKDLRETVSSFHTTITERLDGLDLRVAAIEDVLSRQRGPTTPNAGEVPTGVTTGETLQEATTGASPVDGTHGETTTCTAPEEGTTEEALVEATTRDSIAELDTSKGEARVELTVGEVLVEATTTHDDAPKPVIGSIERGVKARQIRKRKIVTSPFTHTYRKSRARTNDVVASTQAAEPAAEVSTDDAIKVDDPQAATVVVEEHQTEVSKDEPIEVDDPQTAIVVVEEHQSEASEALHVVEFSSRAVLPKRMLNLIDTSCSRFKDKIQGWEWRLSLSLAGIPAILLILGSLLVVDTPNSLIQRGQVAAGLAALIKIRGTENVGAEFNDILTASRAALQAKHPFRNLFLRRRNRPQLIISIFLQFFQQLTGINAIMFYAPVLFNSLGFKSGASLYSAVIIGAVIVLSTIISIYFVDRVGRRPLLLEAGMQMFVSLAAITVVLGLKMSDSSDDQLGRGWAMMVVVMVCMFVSGFAWSWGPLGWLIPSEIFEMEIRSAGQSVAVCANLFFTFVIAQAFLSMLCGFKYGIFAFFSAWVVVMSAFVMFLLPETKKVGIAEMNERVWKKHWYWSRFMDFEEQEDDDDGDESYSRKVVPV